jgi:hypothetical protein
MTTKSLFEIPNQKHYFKDHVEGEIHNFGRVLVNEESIIEFASRMIHNFTTLIPKRPKAASTAVLFPAGGIPRQ